MRCSSSAVTTHCVAFANGGHSAQRGFSSRRTTASSLSKIPFKQYKLSGSGAAVNLSHIIPLKSEAWIPPPSNHQATMGSIFVCQRIGLIYRFCPSSPVYLPLTEEQTSQIMVRSLEFHNSNRYQGSQKVVIRTANSKLVQEVELRRACLIVPESTKGYGVVRKRSGVISNKSPRQLRRGRQQRCSTVILSKRKIVIRTFIPESCWDFLLICHRTYRPLVLFIGASDRDSSPKI
ncbi:hypothetical protein EYF80_002324 [Liparis tanakae]|uniref:Uncharacterized protein n=1 Tax=Liparis tanakae TaxID=230148 RepID=A0A4Z2JC82_9TELE|nr:hypothetical protein EYF80_002324 [Liparis tanakae]